MTTTALGDMAQGFLLRTRSNAIKQDMQRLSAELTTGQVADVRSTLAGNYSFLTDVERKVAVLDTYNIATAEAAHFTSTMQLSLTHFSDLAGDLSGKLISAASSSAAAATLDTANDARATLDGLMNTLNTNIAGRSLFGGNATDRAPLVDSATLLSDLTTAMAGAATPADMMAAAQTWFDDPAGFAATAYQGSTQSLSPFALSKSDRVAIDVRADDARLKQSLKSAAVAALATDPAFGLSVQDQSTLYALAGQDLLAGQADLVGLQAQVGSAEAQIDTITARNAAEVTSLTLARNALLAADPYETATKLEEVQFQLQSLYSVTVRMSQLSLVNYL